MRRVAGNLFGLVRCNTALDLLALDQFLKTHKGRNYMRFTFSTVNGLVRMYIPDLG